MMELVTFPLVTFPLVTFPLVTFDSADDGEPITADKE